MSTRAAAAAAALAVLACAHLACAHPPAPPLATVSDGRPAMGTLLELTLVGRDAARLRALAAELFAEAQRQDALFTTWDAASETSRLDTAAGRGPQPVAPELAQLLARSQELSRATRGAFDVTVGPLVALWREAAAQGEWPSAEALAAARARVGSDRLRVAGDRAELLAGSSVNLSGVAKGWALDRMLPRLREAGVDAALLSFGQSSIWALGAPPDAPAGWRLLARAPGGGFLGVLVLRDRALSVSESMGEAFEIGGRRVGHVLDPRSGMPLEEDREALVAAPDATLAEALSKAVLVLGPDAGLALVAAEPGCEALLADADGRTWRTPGWDASLGWEPIAQAP